MNTVYYSRELEPGKWLEVMPLTFGRARIILTDRESIFDGW